MDKLIKKHLEAIEHDDCWIANECTPPDFEVEIAAQKSAEITKEECIKFAKWRDKLSCSQRISLWSEDGSQKGIFEKSDERLFEQYLKESEL